jgi:hypothetical protein
MEHKTTCAFRVRTVVVELSIRYVTTVQESLDVAQIRDCLNRGKGDEDAVDAMVELQEGRAVATVAYVREATAEDELQMAAETCAELAAEQAVPPSRIPAK